MKNDKDKVILLVEDNPDDEALTLRARQKNDILLVASGRVDEPEADEFKLGVNTVLDSPSRRRNWWKHCYEQTAAPAGRGRFRS